MGGKAFDFVRVPSTELRQVFRAYTKQLRAEHLQAKRSKASRPSRVRGLEKVSISDEAKKLAAAHLHEAEPDQSEGSVEEPGKEIPEEADAEVN